MMIAFKSLKITQATIFQKAPDWLPQALKFGVVGVLNTGVDWGLYALLSGGLLFRPAAAKAISYGAGVANSYLLNRKWTFSSTVELRRSFGLFLLANLGGTIINVGVMSFAIQVLRLPSVMALALATGITMIWNFLLGRNLIFREGTQVL
jgi:putative flippase GtrA